MYYHIMMAWHRSFVYFYLLNITAIFFSVLMIVPMWGFLTGRYFLFPRFWMSFFWIRLIFEFIGRPYETSFIKSIYLNNPLNALLFILLLAFINLPSYIMLWIYAKSFPRRN